MAVVPFGFIFFLLATSAQLLVSHDFVLVTEDGGTSDFSVSLDKEPKDAVWVLLSQSDATEFTLSKTSILFDKKNWNQPQFVQVKAHNDYIFELWKDHKVFLQAVSSDPHFSGKVLCTSMLAFYLPYFFS